MSTDISDITSQAQAEGQQALLQRIADALERMSPPTVARFDSEDADAFVWHADDCALHAVQQVNRVPLDLLMAIDRVKDTLMDNTRRFAQGNAANNVLLWGARGTGKSSLIKAAHAAIINEQRNEGVGDFQGLALVEIHREDIATLPRLLALLSQHQRRFLLFCDDLSFDDGDSSYKSLKAVLDGGIEGRPQNLVFYATSNRRHLLSRDMIENESSTAIHASEAVEEKVSLSDRFGLWLGFHASSQDEYLSMIKGYVDYYDLTIDSDKLRVEAIEWSMTRGARSGRVAWQYILDLAGRLGKSVG